MGIIKAFFDSIGGNLADQWLEVIEADNMSDTTVFTSGKAVRTGKRNSNKKGSDDYISDGSVIHVYDNQFMLLVDGGKVVDYTAEPGYYKVDTKSAPSLFNGQFGDTLKEMFSRIKFGGVPSGKQKAYYINLQEIKGIKFGTRAPVSYFDGFYNAELFLRAFGTYSIKITNPLKFYKEAISRNADSVDINDINEQYLSEFLEALSASINKMSVDGIRVSHIASKSPELSKYMASELDEEWNELRGFEVLSVGIASISYDEESKKLINMRNQGAMLGDPSVREGYIQGAVARGIENAGSNPNGSATAFMGMGLGMNAGGSFIQGASQANMAQIEKQQKNNANGWTCSCGQVNQGNFCQNCGSKKPVASGWTCSCGANNTGNFCQNCGSKKPEASAKFCQSCGAKVTGKFCPECGSKL
ncbi:MAG: SPFH domain-containing protein [Clostridia bacterium]|nr:SPFH domain-containing protein [Clostridia bacterium]